MRPAGDGPIGDLLDDPLLLLFNPLQIGGKLASLIWLRLESRL